jgi:hypothetical protein
MMVESDLMFLAIQAIKELGKGGISDEIIMKLTGVLRHVDPDQFRKDTKLAPVWIKQILYAIARKIDHHD